MVRGSSHAHSGSPVTRPANHRPRDPAGQVVGVCDIAHDLDDLPHDIIAGGASPLAMLRLLSIWLSRWDEPHLFLR
jgi:hypothetical protein